MTEVVTRIESLGFHKVVAMETEKRFNFHVRKEQTDRQTDRQTKKVEQQYKLTLHLHVQLFTAFVKVRDRLIDRQTKRVTRIKEKRQIDRKVRLKKEEERNRPTDNSSKL